MKMIINLSNMISENSIQNHWNTRYYHAFTLCNSAISCVCVVGCSDFLDIEFAFTLTNVGSFSFWRCPQHTIHLPREHIQLVNRTTETEIAVLALLCRPNIFHYMIWRRVQWSGWRWRRSGWLWRPDEPSRRSSCISPHSGDCSRWPSQHK